MGDALQDGDEWGLVIDGGEDELICEWDGEGVDHVRRGDEEGRWRCWLWGLDVVVFVPIFHGFEMVIILIITILDIASNTHIPDSMWDVMDTTI